MKITVDQLNRKNHENWYYAKSMKIGIMQNHENWYYNKNIDETLKYFVCRSVCQSGCCTVYL